MRQRRFSLKPPKDEMPSPGDPRLKAYEQQREMDRQALLLIGLGVPIQEAYRSVAPKDCDAQAAQRFSVTARGKRQMPLIP